MTSIVWLDGSNENSEETAEIQQQLRVLDSNFKHFIDNNTCQEYLKCQSDTARITLIVSGVLGKEIVPDIHELTQIVGIYVYCINQEAHKIWASKFEKVKGVYTKFDELHQQIQGNQKSKIHQSIIKETPVDDTPLNEIENTETNIKLDITYMLAEACCDYFARMNIYVSTKDQFITSCHSQCNNIDNSLGVLQEFQDGYNSSKAIHWLYRDPCFCRLIEYYFGIASIDELLFCQFFIHDIQKQLEEHKCTSTIQGFSYELMSNEKFEELKNSVGKVISMRSFLLAYSDIHTALTKKSNSRTSDNSKQVIYVIEANPATELVKPFAEIGSLTNQIDSNPVLFMIGSLFQITEILDEKDGITQVKMSLCGDDKENTLKQLFNQIKIKYIASNGETEPIGFGQLLYDIGKSINGQALSDKGELIIRAYVGTLQDDHIHFLRGHCVLGSMDLLAGNLDSSLVHFKKACEIQQETVAPNDPLIAESYLNIATILEQQRNFKEALEYFLKVLSIYKQCYGDYDMNLLTLYYHMASIHENEENISEAIVCYYQLLTIMMKQNVTDSSSYAAVYNNLGKAFTQREEYHLALGFYKTSLDMKLKYLSQSHLSIAVTYQNIGVTYESLDKIQEARENLEKAASIYRELYSADDARVQQVEDIIQALQVPSA